MTFCAAWVRRSRTRVSDQPQTIMRSRSPARKPKLFAFHEPVMRTRLTDFGADFLGRVLAALLMGGEDYVRAVRQRRAMIAEMSPPYAKNDVLLTAGPGPAARLDAGRTIHFWQQNSVATRFNVIG